MKKTLLRAFLLALLACLLVLPMTFMVGAADGDTVDGYYFVDRFKTNWAGSSITNGTAWGYKWVRSDGANNGSILIPNGLTTNNQVSLSDDGVLSFWNIGSAKCKIMVYELAMNKVESGPAMMKFDLLFNPETFSGFDISFMSSSQNRTLFHTTAEGKLTVTNSFTDTGWSLAEGWNTVYIYFLPKYPEVDNPNTPSVDETTVQNGVACFYALENSERQVPDTRGVTLENLRAQTDVYYEFDYSFQINGNYCDLASLSTQLWTKAVTPENKGYSLANMEYFNLEKGPLYSVNYTGYPELTSYVSMTDLANSTLAVPGAEGVTYWKGVDANGNEGYYAVGDHVKVRSSMTMTRAEGDDLLIAELGAAIAKVNVNNISSYTYVEIDAALADLNTAMTNFTQGGGSTENEYYVQAVQVSAVLNSAKSARKQASDALIAYAAIFSDIDEDLEVRMEAYEEALALDGAYDGTYVDGSGYLCQNAIYALDEFTACVDALDGEWERYQDAIEALEEADSTTDVYAIYEQLVPDLKILRRYFWFVPGGEEAELIDACEQAHEALAAAVESFAPTNAASITALENAMSDSRAQNSTSDIAEEARTLLDGIHSAQQYIAYAATIDNSEKTLLEKCEAYVAANKLTCNTRYPGYAQAKVIIDGFASLMHEVEQAYESYSEKVAAFEQRGATADSYLLFERAYNSYLELLRLVPETALAASMEPFRGAWLAVESAVAAFDPASENARQLLAALEQRLAQAGQLGDVENTAATVIAGARTTAKSAAAEIEKTEQTNGEMTALLGGWEDDLSIEELYALLYDAIALKLSSEKYLSEDNLALLEAYIEEYNALVRVHNQDIEDAIYVACTVAGRAESFEIEVAPPPAQYAEKKEEEEQV